MTELANNYINQNLVWIYYKRNQLLVYSTCKNIRENDREEIRKWIIMILKPEELPVTRSITKGVISEEAMDQFCKQVGQRYDDHICSRCSGRNNFIPDVML